MTVVAAIGSGTSLVSRLERFGRQGEHHDGPGRPSRRVDHVCSVARVRCRTELGLTYSPGKNAAGREYMRLSWLASLGRRREVLTA